MKQFKPVIITAIVFVIIAVAALVTFKLLPAVNDNGDELVLPEMSETSVKIIERSPDDVKSVEITTNSGESFAIDYSKNSIGVRTAVMRDAGELLRYSESDMTTLSSYVGFLSALEEIGAGEGAAFGFGKPSRTISVTFTDGERVTLLLGSRTPLGDGMYLRRTDRDTVYTIGTSTAEILMRTKSDYRDIELFDEISSTDLLTSVTVSKAGVKPLTIVRKPEADEEKDTSDTEAMLVADYAITSPISRDTNPDTVGPELLDKIIAIKAESLIEDNPKDLNKYGLSDPVKLKFTTSEGTDVSLLIGGKTPSGGRYVMPEGIPTVIATEDDCDLTGLSYADIASPLIWYYKSGDVSGFTYELSGGVRHTLSLETKDNALTGVYDGKTLTGSNATNLFLRTIRFSVEDAYTSDMKYGKRVVKATVTLKSGATSTLELFEINERRYAAVVDGKTAEFCVAVEEVRELLESFDILARGEDIPDMF